MKEFMIARLESKKKEYQKYKNNFTIMVNVEMNSSTFEENAINLLMVMMKMKAEINQLEYDIATVEIQERVNE